MDLQAQIDELRNKLDSLEKSSSIPRPVENAFRTRLGDINGKIGSVSTTSIGGNVGFDLPNTTGTLQIIVNGKTYNVLYQ